MLLRCFMDGKFVDEWLGGHQSHTHDPRAKILIIPLTSLDSAEDHGRCLDAGVDDHFENLVRLDQLRHCQGKGLSLESMAA